MGNFYINVVVKGVSSATLRQALASLPFSSIVAPDVDGHSFIYGDFFGSGDMHAGARLAQQLSEEAGAEYAAFCLNADDDFFAYEFWQRGERLDAYYSSPEAFEPDETDAEAPRGDPLRLKSTFPFIDAQAVRTVLDREDYIFEFERHQELFRLLRIPAGPAIMDFQYLQNGEVPEGVEETRLIRIDP
jgi:hypothetical protein